MLNVNIKLYDCITNYVNVNKIYMKYHTCDK